MALAAGVEEEGPPFVVYRIDAQASGLYLVYVQMPDGTTTAILVPGTGVTFDRIRLAAEVVAQLWETKRGATPIGQD